MLFLVQVLEHVDGLNFSEVNSTHNLVRVLHQNIELILLKDFLIENPCIISLCRDVITDNLSFEFYKFYTFFFLILQKANNTKLPF